MEKFSYDGLTHDSGKEFNARAVSKKLNNILISNVLCQRLKDGSYMENTHYDGFGIYYLTDISIRFPEGTDYLPVGDTDYKELYCEIDNTLRERGLSHYSVAGCFVPKEGDKVLTIRLEDDRRPPISWDECESKQEQSSILPGYNHSTQELMDDGLPF